MTTASTEQDLPAQHDLLETRPVLCVQEAAQLLGISPWLLLQEIKRNRLPHKRVGRRLVFSRQRLLDWLASDES